MKGDTLSRTKIGLALDCSVCGRLKKPCGRSAPVESSSSLCDHECDGYYQDPKPGSLWPGESELQFGYSVGSDGVRS